MGLMFNVFPVIVRFFGLFLLKFFDDILQIRVFLMFRYKHAARKFAAKALLELVEQKLHVRRAVCLERYVKSLCYMLVVLVV